jgi:dCTP deaminase
MSATGISGHGVLPVQELRSLVTRGTIRADQRIEARQYQPASLDLRIGARAHRVRSSFLPGQQRVRERLQTMGEYDIDLSEGGVLERGVVYIVPLLESLDLPSDIYARANPRSTTGRLDVFTRLITDSNDRFEEVRAGYKGELFLEIVPGTFPIRLREGDCLNQMRFIRGNPILSDQELYELCAREPLLRLPPGEHPQTLVHRISDGLFLSIDLEYVSVPGQAERIVAYRSRRHRGVVDLSRINSYDPSSFWDVVAPTDGLLTLEPDGFYLVASYERVRIPLGYAAEIVAYDTLAGELRTHYAGFFDPGFGYGRDGSIDGTPAVLEVRAHQVPFSLEHRQFLCRLRFERLTALSDYAYGDSAGASYHAQTLSLPKQFIRPSSE